jgi:hypothetical protein
MILAIASRMLQTKFLRFALHNIGHEILLEY